MARLSMSTLVSATTALLRSMELLREGRFFSVLRVERALTFQLRSIDILMDSEEDIYSHPFPHHQLPAVTHYFQKILRDPPIDYATSEILAEPLRSQTIHMDVKRTRSTLMTPQLHTEMEHMLNHFCRVRKLVYKQGLNEIIAPFAMLREGGFETEQVYALFGAFFDSYGLNFYYDKDFNSLEIIFRMVALVIKYHDPGLSRYLEIYDIEPQIYCVGWLMTLFGSKLSLKLCYTLWLFLATDRDPYLTFFLIVAVILMRREQIIQSKNHSIFTVVTALLFRDEQELVNALKVALLLRKNTPSSLTIFFKEKHILMEKNSFQRLGDLVKKIQKLNLFIVSSEEISLRQHFRPGLCERHCYFCQLREPPRLPFSHEHLKQIMPHLNELLQMDGDIRHMNFNIDFVVLDVRANKEKKLPQIEGIIVYQIDPKKDINTEVGKFNDKFLEMRGREHFLFLLNEFSFEQEKHSSDLPFCRDLINILNSFSYPHLSMLEGGERAYFNFMRDLQMKSQLINSRLIPVSECESAPDYETPVQIETKPLSISEIVMISQLYDFSRLHWFIGRGASQGQILFILQGAIAIIESNPEINKLLRFLKQHKSIMEYLVEEQEAIAVSCQILQLHFLSHITKMTVRLHHNNCIIFYVSTPHTSSLPRRAIWNRPLADLVRSDLIANQQVQKQSLRVGFESEGLEQVKEISHLIKQNFKTMLHVKQGLISEMQRRDELNYNIIEDLDFSRKQRLS